MNKELEVEHVGAGFVRKTVACHISKREVVRGDPRAVDELITKRLEEEAGLESHYNKPFVARQVHYMPDTEVYRISLTWFEFENNSKDQLASSLIEHFQQNNHNVSKEMEPTMLNDHEIQSRFGKHAGALEGPNPNGVKHKMLRSYFTDWARTIDELMPDGRNKSLALTAFEEASMWSHKAVAND